MLSPAQTLTPRCPAEEFCTLLGGYAAGGPASSPHWPSLLVCLSALPVRAMFRGTQGHTNRHKWACSLAFGVLFRSRVISDYCKLPKGKSWALEVENYSQFPSREGRKSRWLESNLGEWTNTRWRVDGLVSEIFINTCMKYLVETLLFVKVWPHDLAEVIFHKGFVGSMLFTC